MTPLALRDTSLTLRLLKVMCGMARTYSLPFADVVELVDTLVLGTSASA